MDARSAAVFWVWRQLGYVASDGGVATRCDHSHLPTRHAQTQVASCRLRCGALERIIACFHHLPDAHYERQPVTAHLTNRWSQPLAGVKSTFNFMKQFSMFAALAAASGGSAPSR